MKLRELSQLYHLSAEIKECRQRLKDLEDSLVRISAPEFKERSHPTGYVQSKIDALTAEIVDLKVIILSRETQCVAEKNRLERYIAQIDDSYTRRIFTLRFVEGLTWLQVAQKIGNNTEASVRNACIRYLEKTNKK